MPFQLPNQQRQSTEGTKQRWQWHTFLFKVKKSLNHTNTNQCLAFKHRRSTIEHEDGFHMIEQQFTDAAKHSNKVGIRQRVAIAITQTFVCLM